MLKIDIPESLSHLQRDSRGYPIPYFVPVVNGIPEFKYQDPKKHATAIKYKKCCICGKRLLRGQYWFISGPKGFENCVDSHAPMHESCARFALLACPHLYLEKTHRVAEGIASVVQLRDKPNTFYLSKADHFYTVPSPDIKNFNLVKFRVKTFEIYAYIEGKLKQIANGSTG